MQWLRSRQFGMLADEMGLGKTVQALTAARLTKSKRITVLCPAAVTHMWERKAEEVFGRSTRVYSFNKAEEAHDLSYLGVLIVDEWHYLKNPEANRTNVVLGKGGLIHHCDRAWALSGTPMPNHPGELWSWMYVTGATNMSYEKWVQTFCTMGRFKKIRGARKLAIPQLRKLLSGHILRRLQRTVMKDLPPVRIDTLNIKTARVNPAELDYWFPSIFLNGQSVADFDARIAEETETLKKALATGDPGELELIAEHLATLHKYFGMLKMPGIGKLLVEELEQKLYSKIVVFAMHRNVLFGLRDYLKLHGVKSVMMFGGSTKREKVIDDFINDRRVAVFLGQINAAGTGVDGLQEVCHNVLLAERAWSPSVNDQAIARLARIGQKNPVNVRIAAAEGTLDEALAGVLKRKTEDTQEIMKGVEG